MSTKINTIIIRYKDTSVKVSVPNSFITSMRAQYACTESKKNLFVFTSERDFYDCANAIKE